MNNKFTENHILQTNFGVRPKACCHLKNLCKLVLRLKSGLRTKSDLFYQVAQCS